MSTSRLHQVAPERLDFAVPVCRRPRMSAASRKAVGERMRKYWARRRDKKVAKAGVKKTVVESRR